VRSATSSIVCPDLVFILVSILYLAILVVGSTYWFGCYCYPSSSKKITSFNIITGNLRTTIVCWWFPANLDKVSVSINSKWSSRLARNIILCLWHGFIRCSWCTSALGINSKHSEFISISFQETWNLLCLYVWSNIIYCRYPSTSMVKILLFNHISSDFRTTIIFRCSPGNCDRVAINVIKLNGTCWGSRNIKNVKEESSLIRSGFIDKLNDNITSIRPLAVDNMEGCDWSNGRDSCPFITHQWRSIDKPINIRIWGSNVFNINCEVVASLHIDILHWGEDLRSQISWSGLNGITRWARFRHANSIPSNNPKVVVFLVSELICSSFVDISCDLCRVSPRSCSLNLHLNDISFNSTATIIERLVPCEINECSIPIISFRSSGSFWYITFISSNEGFVKRKRFGLSNGIDSHDSHQIFFFVDKAADCNLKLSCNFCLNPGASAKIHLLNSIMGNWRSTII